MKQGVIVGFGNMGQTHYDRYKRLNTNISVVENDKQQQKLAKQKNILVYASLEQIQNINEIDFIDICTPTYLHYPHLIQAMKYQKPIFVEKPIVRTTDEVRSIRKLVNNYHYPIFVGEVELYNPCLLPFINYQDKPQHISIKREVDLDFFLKGSQAWFLDEKLSGGIVLDLMIHDVTLLFIKYGKPKISKVVAKTKKYDCIDDVNVSLDYNSFSADLWATWVSKNSINPILTTIKINDLNIKCDNYLIRSQSNEADAFYMEIKQFLNSITINKTPYPINIFLDAVEVADGIFLKCK